MVEQSHSEFEIQNHTETNNSCGDIKRKQWQSVAQNRKKQLQWQHQTDFTDLELRIRKKRWIRNGICASTLLFPPSFYRCTIWSRNFSFPCHSKLSKFMANPFFSDLTTNKIFSIVDSYGATNEFRQNHRSTWPNFLVHKWFYILLHFRQECINKTALPYRSWRHERRERLHRGEWRSEVCERQRRESWGRSWKNCGS